MVRHQRQSERKRTRVKARVFQVANGEEIAGFTRDISPQGLFVQTRAPFPAGTQIMVELLYPDAPVHLEGRVVRAMRAPAHLQAVQASGMGIQVQESRSLALAAGSSRDRRITMGSSVVVFFGSERRQLQLHDLSTSGCALLASTKPPEMGFVRMHFKLPPDGTVIELEGMPVVTRPYGDQTLIGINFVDPSAETVARIQSLIAARCRGQEESLAL